MTAMFSHFILRFTVSCLYFLSTYPSRLLNGLLMTITMNNFLNFELMSLSLCNELSSNTRLSCDHSNMQARTSPPLKRARLAPSPDPTPDDPNGHAPPAPLPPLSLSILGVEPLDEFIREIADWVNHMIMTRPGAAEYPGGKVEVEAKIGVLRDRVTGARFALPVLVETGVYPFFGFFFFF